MSGVHSLDIWLSILYKADISDKLAVQMEQFKDALTVDPTGLAAQAQSRLKELNEMIAVRGERACAYSTKYRNFLQEAFT